MHCAHKLDATAVCTKLKAMPKLTARSSRDQASPQLDTLRIRQRIHYYNGCEIGTYESVICFKICGHFMEGPNKITKALNEDNSHGM
jgi:hypothetical protein